MSTKKAGLRIKLSVIPLQIAVKCLRCYNHFPTSMKGSVSRRVWLSKEFLGAGELPLTAVSSSMCIVDYNCDYNCGYLGKYFYSSGDRQATSHVKIDHQRSENV
jgi:hypothetical protein